MSKSITNGMPTFSNPDGTPAELTPAEQSEAAQLAQQSPSVGSPSTVLPMGKAPQFTDPTTGQPAQLSPAEAKQARQAAGIIDPLQDMSPQEMAELAHQAPKAFTPLQAFLSRPDLQSNTEVLGRAAEAHRLYKDTTGAFEGVTPGSVASSVGGFFKGLGKWALAAADTPLEAFVPDEKLDPQQLAEKRATQQKLAEAASGTALDATSIANQISGVMRSLYNRASAVSEAQSSGEFSKAQPHIKSPSELLSPDAKIQEFLSDVAHAKQLQDIAAGHAGDPVFHDLTKGGDWETTIANLEKNGYALRPEEVSSYAAGDPVTATAFGKAFGAAAKLGGAVLPTEAINAGLTAMGNQAARAVGGAIEKGATGIGATAKLAEKAAPALGLLTGLGKGAYDILQGDTVEGLKTLALSPLAGKAIAETAAKARPFVAGMQAFGKQVASGESITSSAAQGIRDALQVTPTAAAELAKGVAFDLGTAAAGETPEEKGGVGLGTVFGLAGAAGRFVPHVVSGQIIGARDWGSDTTVPSNGYFPGLDALHSQGYSQAAPGIRRRINSVRAVLKSILPNSDFIYAPPPAEGAPDALPQQLVSLGVTPETADLWSKQEGLTSHSLPGGKTLVLARDIGAAPHEAVGHGLENVLGEGIMRQMDSAIQSDPNYQGNWDGIAKYYAGRLGWDGSGNWQDFLLDKTGWGNNYAKEKTGFQSVPTGPLTPEQANAAFQDAGGDWRKILTPQEQSEAADSYISREIFAENADALFKRTGPSLKAGGLPMKIAQVIAAFTRAIGGEPLAGRTSEGLGLPLSSDVIEAIQRGGQAVLTKEPAIIPKLSIGKSGAAVPVTPQQQQQAADEARQAAAVAPNTPVAGGTQSQREILGAIAESIASRTGLKLNYLSAPDEPAAGLGSGRKVRRALIEIGRTMPASARSLWEKLFFPERVLQNKDGSFKVSGWAPEVFAANVHRTAQELNRLGESGLVPYPVDLKSGSLTPEGWQQLYGDVQKAVRNYVGGRTASGEEIVVPKNAVAAGASKPPVRGTAEPLDQNKADFISAMFGVKLPGTTRISLGELKLPTSIVGEDISRATLPGRVQPPVEPRGAFTGPKAEALGIEGRQIMEVNPWRNRAEAAGFDPSKLIEARQNLNVDNIKEAALTPEQPQFRSNTLTLQAGFLPKETTQWTKNHYDAYGDELHARRKFYASLPDEIRPYYNIKAPTKFLEREKIDPGTLGKKSQSLLTDWQQKANKLSQVEGARPEGAVTYAEQHRAIEGRNREELARLNNLGPLWSDEDFTPQQLADKASEMRARLAPAAYQEHQAARFQPAELPPEKEANIRDRIARGIPPENIRLSIFNDPALPPEYHGVQVDEIDPSAPPGQRNTFSSNPEDMRRLGYDMPPTSELLKLPFGQHTLAAANDILKSGETEAQFKPKTFIVRHGSTEMNNSNPDKDLIRGHIDVPLDEKGKQEAKDTAAQIAAQGGVKHIVASDLGRTLQTAAEIAKATGATIEPDPGLRPWNFGPTIEGKPTSKMLPKIAEITENPDTRPPGGETFNEFKDRFLSAWDRAQSRFPDQNTAVVTHYRGTKLLDAWRAAGVDNNEIDKGVFETYDKNKKPGHVDVVDKTGAQFKPKTTKLTHYTTQEDLDTLNPKFHGTGLTGAELARKRDYPELYVPRTYFGTPGYEKEGGLGNVRYKAEIRSGKLYNLNEDPENLYPSSEELEKMGYAPMDQRAALSIYEKRIQKAGFEGYVNKDAKVVAKFTETPVTKMRPLRSEQVQYSPGGDPKAIRAAAIRDPDTGEVTEGPMHFFARQAYTADHPDFDPMKFFTFEEGFTDNAGNFLNRNQAFERAKEMNQLKGAATPGQQEVQSHFDAMKQLAAERVSMPETAQFVPGPTVEEFKDEKTLPGALAKPNWAVLTATQESQGAGTDPVNVTANAELLKSLKAAGFNPVPVQGNYKGVDQGLNYLVTGMTPQEAVSWGRRYGQESVLTPQGLLYGDGSLNPAKPEENVFGDKAKKQDFYSQIENGPAFSMGIDFGKRVPAAVATGALPGFEGEIGSPKTRSLSTVEKGNMTMKQLGEQFPESVIPHKKDEAIPSKITESPLYKKAGSEANAVKAFSDRLVDFAKQYSDHPAFEDGKTWYDHIAPKIKKHFGKTGQLFAELLAATSAGQKPDTNFADALAAHDMTVAGKYDKQSKKLIQGLDMVESGAWKSWLAKHGTDLPAEPTPETFLGQWIDTHNLRPRKENGALYGYNSVQVLKVAARRWLQEAGPKTSNFIQNLLGTGHEATIDLWADRTMRWAGYEGQKERWRILPENKSGVSDEDFAFAQKAFSAAAKELGMRPDQLQGALWFAEKQRWSDNGWSLLDLGTYEPEFGKIAQRRAGTRQIATLKAQAKKAPPALTGAQLGFSLGPEQIQPKSTRQ